MIKKNKREVLAEFEADFKWNGWVRSELAPQLVEGPDYLDESIGQKFVLCKEFDSGFVVKAEVLGAVGIVAVTGEQETDEEGIPIILVSEVVFDQIVKKGTKAKGMALDGDGKKLYLLE